MLDPERREGLLDAIGAVIDREGGRFVVGYDTWLVTAQGLNA